MRDNDESYGQPLRWLDKRTSLVCFMLAELCNAPSGIVFKNNTLGHLAN